MRLLELFSGTGSIGKVAIEAGWEVVSLDLCDKYSTPTHKENILNWNYRIYPPHHFDIVWASPPCTHYSKAKTRGVRDIIGSNAIVARVLEIITYFSPPRWFIENPDTGKLKDQEMMLGLPFEIFDYCRFGFLYRKRTRIWTNVLIDSCLCEGPALCPAMVGNKHRLSCGNGTAIYTEQSLPLAIKYSIPSALVKYLFNVE